MTTGRPRRPATIVAQAGRKPEWTHGIVNPPIYRASTCLFPDLASLDAAIADPDSSLSYGRYGTPTTWALESALTELEPGAAGTRLYPSGMAAISTALLTVLGSGDHLLMVDTAYAPTRIFAHELHKLGIETSYYDPLIGPDIIELIRPNTRAILLESPGSLTFEVQDVPAITAVARERGIVTILDNSWATSLLFPAIAHGVDLSVQALTKYVAGHSDIMMGSITAAPALWPNLKTTNYRFGQCVSPDDAYLALRGLRTLNTRLERHGHSARTVANWLAHHPLVDRVLHPALPTCPGHTHFIRDFAGSSGLFSFVLRRGCYADTAALIDNLVHFGIGFSWGGYESLVFPTKPQALRTATRWQATGPLIRLHIGLEDPDDLIADLDQGLAIYDATVR